MALLPRSRLGPYEVVAQVGRGGMGEVYRARDTQLHRDVALKVLSDSVTHDADRVTRLRREARVLASLNHPHIGGIHGLVDEGDVIALVLEFVEGPTLADRIADGPLPVDDALSIARQIADALETAHGQGIVHRDLKPSNVKLRPDGTVKVLDFGLAKSTGPVESTPELAAAPTITSEGNVTGAGTVLGTAAYMSPEQARGQAVDSRTDIWSFGCVLFEMLTARPAFPGENLSDVMASVLRSEPDWTSLPPSANRLAPVLHRCLEKDVRRRLRDIGDVKLLLEDAAAREPGTVPPAPSRRARWIAAAAVAGAILGAAAIALFRSSTVQTVAEPVERFQLMTPPAQPLATQTYGPDVAISPDGGKIVYTSTRNGTSELVVRRLDRLEPTTLDGTSGGVSPFFSPDGQQIGFATFTELKRVAFAGGPVTSICPVDPYFSGAAWGPDGTIVFAAGSLGLFRVSASGGEPQRLAVPDTGKSERRYMRPALLPGGRAMLYTVLLADGSTQIRARRLDASSDTTVVEAGFDPKYLPSGYLLYAQTNRLMSVRFDVSALRTSGEAVSIDEGVLTKTVDDVAEIAVASNGTAVYVTGRDTFGADFVVWLNPDGTRGGRAIEQPLTSPRFPRISPDGKRLALIVGPSGQGQLWIYSLDGTAQPLKLTFQDHALYPAWSPDGTRVAILRRAGSVDQIMWIATDGSMVQPERLATEDGLGVPLSWSRNGEYVLFQRPASRKLWLLHTADRTTRQWLQTPFEELGGSLSPDGRWVAYVSNQTGTEEIWIRPLEGNGPPVRVSSDGGHKPAWSGDGKEIYYENGPKLMAARVAAQPGGLRVESARMLVDGGFVHDDTDPLIRFFDVAPDGRFIVVQPPPADGPRSIVVARHWDGYVRSLFAGK